MLFLWLEPVGRSDVDGRRRFSIVGIERAICERRADDERDEERAMNCGADDRLVQRARRANGARFEKNVEHQITFRRVGPGGRGRGALVLQ
jgi:hypothetical protein